MYMVVDCVIVRGTPSTQRKPQAFWKSQKSFTTYTCMEYTSTRTENELITVRHLLNMHMYIQLPYDRGHDCPFQHLHYIYEIWSCFIHSMYTTCGKNTDIYCELLNFDGLFENACPLIRHIIYNIWKGSLKIRPFLIYYSSEGAMS